MRNFNQTLRTTLILSLGMMLFLTNGCKKTEDKLIATELPEPGFQLPQGDNDYDKRIMDYYKRWDSYVLYKFTQQDINWMVTGYDAYYKSIPAIAEYINPQLDLLESTFFKYYSDATLKQFLPRKVFLCSSLGTGTTTITQVETYLLPFVNGRFGGYQSFALNGGNAGVPTINKAVYRGNVNFSFLKMMDLEGKMKRSEAFTGISDYTNPVAGTTQADRYKRGFLVLPANLPVVSLDWQAFIQVIVSNPYTYLTDPATTASDTTPKGILSPVKDANGLIKRKYDAMVSFYKQQYGIDLQAIGDGK
ncbi:hypothetical protein [Pedobacter gandavensis]|uniref:hypothetical protein n=1 Tax=Pedobacter gandavensis TaxID=2679963 RepID=UPI00292F2792|nr:hypothetical protein [Pedobacter gandavensis]